MKTTWTNIYDPKYYCQNVVTGVHNVTPIEMKTTETNMSTDGNKQIKASII